MSARALAEVERAELERFCRQLGDVRAARGLTLRGVHEVTDGTIGYSGLSRIESFDRCPNLRSVQALAKAYDMDVTIKRDGTISIRGTRLNMDNGGSKK